MVVEVTLQQPIQSQPKSCWFPFKEKFNNRRLLQDRTQAVWNDSHSISRSSKRTANDGSTTRTPRGTESVSTGTDASSFAGYSEQDSRTTTSSSSRMRSSASASRFSQCTNSVSNLSQTSHSVSHFTYTASGVSRQPSDAVESAFLKAPHRRRRSRSPSHLGTLPSLDEEDSIVLYDSVGGTSDRSWTGPDDPTVTLALVETNCMAKEFWTDEVVDGGAFSCFQHTEMAKRCIPMEEVEVLQEVQRTDTFNSIVEEKESSGIADDMYSVHDGSICSNRGGNVEPTKPTNASDGKELTNCMAKEFWTDEVVDGGAFSCFQHSEMAKRCIPMEEVEVLQEVQRTDTFNSIVEEKESSYIADDVYSVHGGSICSNRGGDVDPTKPTNASDGKELTNCMAKEFWTDEVVDGGAFSCFQHTEMAKRCIPQEEVEVLHEVQRTVTFNSIVEEKESSENVEDTYSVRRRGICASGGGDVDPAIPTIASDRKDVWRKPNEGSKLLAPAIMLSGLGGSSRNKTLYIAEEPEDINDTKPLRRALCHTIRLKRQGKESRNRRGQEGSIGRSSPHRLKRSEPPKQSQPSLELPVQDSASSPDLALSPTPELDLLIHDAVKPLPSMAALPAKATWGDTGMFPPGCPPPSLKSPCDSSTHDAAKPLPPMVAFPAKASSGENRILPTGCPPPSLKSPFVATRKSLTLKNLTRKEETPNFYVEVEAMSAQLDGVRDLDEINAEEELVDEKREIARTASLVDDDSAFFNDSVNEVTEEAHDVRASPKRSEGLVASPKKGTEEKASLSVKQPFPAGQRRPGLHPPTMISNGNNSRLNPLYSQTTRSLSILNRNQESEQTYVRMSKKVTDRISIVRKEPTILPEMSPQSQSLEGTSKRTQDGNLFSDRFPDRKKERGTTSSQVQNQVLSKDGKEDSSATDTSRWARRLDLHENEMGNKKSLGYENNQAEKSIPETLVGRILETKKEMENQGVNPKHKESKNNFFPPRHLHHRSPSPTQYGTSGWKPASPRQYATTDWKPASPREYATSGWKATTPRSLLSDDTYDWNAGLMSDDERTADFTGGGVHSPKIRNEGQPGKGGKFNSENDDQDRWENSDIGFYRRVRNKPRDGLSHPKQIDTRPIPRSWSVDPSKPDARQVRTSQSSGPSLDYPIPHGASTMKQNISSGSKKNDHGTANPKFDDNFWKEDEVSELGTAAFEVYGSENDSLFGDLQSTASLSTSESSSKSSEISEPLRRNRGAGFQAESGHRSDNAIRAQSGENFSKHSRADLSRYTDHSASKYSSYSRFSRGDTMALTTYLEGDGQMLACMDKWLENH